ncbi:MAG: hypothetical protein FJY29_05200 [Betaproteobacteria bacterium]|nr:hypothetical protein [Betaproteobacteria bacterium]
MGLLDTWRGYRAQQKNRSLEKLGDTLKNQVTTKEQRWEAIEALADSGDFRQAAPQLMKRFELVVDHGIVDKREKDRVVEILVENADLSRPLVCEAVRKQKRIAWPIKIAEKLLPHEGYLELLLESLNTEHVLFDESLHERNIELLLALRELSNPRIIEKVRVLLRSRDEPVRVAALECLEAQAREHDEARQCLKELLAEPLTDDNSRFIGLVKAIVERHNWSSAGPK